VKGPGSVRGPEHSERVYPYRTPEREALAALPGDARILDLGCSTGDNLSRLGAAARVVGLDVEMEALRRAVRLAPVVAGAGEHLPFPDGTFHLVYSSHVLHHAVDHVAVIREVHRVLVPEGLLFSIETVDDSPGIRLARRLHDRWHWSRVHSRFRFEDLRDDIELAGFRIEQSGQFNVVYWVWDVAQIRIPRLAGLVGLAERAERAIPPKLRRYGAHAYLAARKVTMT
jgi:SAM-dependent methyltransferase